MERLKTTAWYPCSKCEQVLHGENFYLLPNGSRTNECCKCYDKHIAQQQVSEIDTQDSLGIKLGGFMDETEHEKSDFMKTGYKELGHYNTAVTVKNRPELLYVLAWCEAQKKDIGNFMYKIDSFPYCLFVHSKVVGWTNLMDRAVYYMPFSEFLDKIAEHYV